MLSDSSYAWLYRDELEPSTVKSISHLELGRLLALRDQLVRNNAGLKGTLKEIIYHTGNFTRFDSWRAFSSYCGTAPFEHRSGTSIHRRKQCHYLGYLVNKYLPQKIPEFSKSLPKQLIIHGVVCSFIFCRSFFQFIACFNRTFVFRNICTNNSITV